MKDNSNWVIYKENSTICKIIETEHLWGEQFFRVWIPAQDVVIRVKSDKIQQLDGATQKNQAAYLQYLFTASKIGDALAHDVLLSPIEASVIPLPHQLKALSRAIKEERIRYLLADEVGLGKTIEAGLIMRELKLRGLARRTLVVAPKGLVTQWVAEMKTHFNEDFRLLIPGDFDAYRRILQNDNIWTSYSQVVCPIDSVKPIEGRRGWSQQQVNEYNRERFEDLLGAGWDLIIVDEAHRLGGTTDQVARYKLGRGLAEASPYLLLLSATPHQGKTEAFHRIISLLDEEAFPDVESIHHERVQPYVIRTEKRRAIDADGKPLFKPRQTRTESISWDTRYSDQNKLYNAVTEYVREGYDRALREKKGHIGFLMILMQRLVTSSTQAIYTTLKRRYEALQAPEEQLSLFPMISDEEWADLDGQEQIDIVIGSRMKELTNERDEVRLLLEMAERTMSSSTDAKAEALLELIYKIQQEESDPDVKLLIFTEFVSTQDMLFEFLTQRGFKVVRLNGSMDFEERNRAQKEFAEDTRIMISTEAGGEGLNLQFCHVVINYDIPWNPMRLEQRIGRVDRIGQTKVVRAINFVLEDTVEHRVREILEHKLSVILQDFGVDKTSDVLDSAQAAQIFDEAYMEAILKPDEVDSAVDKALSKVREQAQAVAESKSVFGESESLDPGLAKELRSHPLPYWIEKMTLSYLESHGGNIKRRGPIFDITWPDGEEYKNIVFTLTDAEKYPHTRHLTLEDSRIRGLAMRLPQFAPGQPIQHIKFDDISSDIDGFWSLWRISIHTQDWNKQRILPLFVNKDGRILMPTAKTIWDKLLTKVEGIGEHTMNEDAEKIYSQLREHAEEQGRAIYDDLVREHRTQLKSEREKGEYSFIARRKAIERIGLEAVRMHRLKNLESEKRRWEEELRNKEEIQPEMIPLIILRITGGS
jgi:superfamily II DNA or RNA helicase